MEVSAAADLLGDLHRRPAGRVLVLLPLVLPRAPHGDEGPHARRAAGRVMVACGAAAVRSSARPFYRCGRRPARPRAAAKSAPGESVQPVLDAAAPGDVIRLAPGDHAGPVTIDRPITLEGNRRRRRRRPGRGKRDQHRRPGRDGARADGARLRRQAARKGFGHLRRAGATAGARRGQPPRRQPLRDLPMGPPDAVARANTMIGSAGWRRSAKPAAASRSGILRAPGRRTTTSATAATGSSSRPAGATSSAATACAICGSRCTTCTRTTAR